MSGRFAIFSGYGATGHDSGAPTRRKLDVAAWTAQSRCSTIAAVKLKLGVNEGIRSGNCAKRCKRKNSGQGRFAQARRRDRVADRLKVSIPTLPGLTRRDEPKISKSKRATCAANELPPRKHDYQAR